MSDTRSKIIAAAYELFLQKGYQEVSIQAISKSAGFTKGAIYYFFENKEQLFEAAFDHYLISEMRTDFSSFSRDSLRDFYDDYLQYARSRQAGTTAEKAGLSGYAYIFEAIKSFPSLLAGVRDSFVLEQRAWIDVIAAARVNGEIATPLDDEQVADLFILTNDGLGMRGLILGDQVRSKEHLRILWDALYRSLAL